MAHRPPAQPPGPDSPGSRSTSTGSRAADAPGPGSGVPGRGRRNTSGLSRDIEVLELLTCPEASEQGGLGVVRIAELLGRDKTVISRTLATLADAGLLARKETTLAYRLGPRLYALAARTAEASLVREARPLLRAIASHTRETTHLCVLRAGNVLTLASELSPYEVSTAAWAGVTTAAWRTPSGRALLSDWDDAALRSWYADHGRDRALLEPDHSAGPSAASMLPPPGRFAVLDDPSPTSAVITDEADLLAEVRRIRARGYATSDEEFETGVVAVSAPVVDFSGRVVAAINVSAPKARIGARLDDLGRYVARCAGQLSDLLGRPAQ
jgi:DNA-binding IclR family transcriptional regulator